MTDQVFKVFKSLAENLPWLIDNAETHNLDMDKVIELALAAHKANGDEMTPDEMFNRIISEMRKEPERIEELIRILNGVSKEGIKSAYEELAKAINEE